MSSRTHRGFTLVELLVVVVIIGMLAGLLVPAVISARAAARKTECMNNQRELANAAIQYETAKGHFPGYRNPTPIMVGVGSPPEPVNSWVTVLFPYLGRGDLWREWRTGYEPSTNYATNPTVDDERHLVRLDQLVCPDDVQDSPCPLSYVANCGIVDSQTAPFPPGSGGQYGDGTNPPDFACNGVFFNRAFNTSITGPVVEVSASSINDGTAQTLMISENVWPTEWFGAGEEKVGFTWRVAPSANDLEIWRMLDDGVESNHSGGVVVTFCDGHGQFLNEDVKYWVYQHLMTPDGQEAQTRIRAVNSSDDYNLAGSLSEGDY